MNLAFIHCILKCDYYLVQMWFMFFKWKDDLIFTEGYNLFYIKNFVKVVLMVNVEYQFLCIISHV